MTIFRYQYGDRPLDGYTVQYGLGRGGFGEVYFALSDSGREVALKAVQNHEDIELRGIRHCMNLKDPRLVTIFDIKHGARGEPFVIMEYVAGPSLRQLLDDAPRGLGVAKSVFLVREIAKGLSYLHSCGIVHRDLKPHNVFFENGIVKIGDYSLSKAISTSHRSGHTVTVGTVHYMAPEIGLGRYDHTVDIYALGVLLHEMMTGSPPFTGDSIGEVLLKHVSGQVDLTGIEEPIATVISKSLAKDPRHRYQSAEELVAVLLGSEEIQLGLSGFNPECLSIVAARRGAERDPPQRVGNVDPRSAAVSPRTTHAPPAQQRKFAETWRREWSEFWGRFSRDFALSVQGWPEHTAPVHDLVTRRQRFAMAFATGVIAWFGLMSVLAPFHARTDPEFYIFVLITAGSCVSLLVQHRLLRELEFESSWMFRLFHAGAFFPVAFFVSVTEERYLAVVVGQIAAMGVLEWRAIGAPIRASRVRMAPLFSGALVAAIGAFLCRVGPGNDDAVMSAGIVAAMLMITQWASPFDAVASRRHKHEFAWMLSLSRLHRLWRRWHAGDHSIDPIRDESPDSQPVNVAPHGPAAAHREATANRAHMPHAMTHAAIPDDQGASEVSPRRRMVALILSVLMPGLQRFYVGRIASGFVWLFTLGLLGIGQLFDMIMIAVGAFRDAQGRRLVLWNRHRESEQVNAFSAVSTESWSTTHMGRRLGHIVLNVAGALFLTIAIGAASLLAINLAAAVAAGVFEPAGLMPHEIEYEFGARDWPLLAQSALALIVAAAGMIAIGLMLAARRHCGIAHMFRAVIAAAGLGAAMFALGIPFQHGMWDNVAAHVRDRMIGQAMISAVTHRDLWPALIFSSMLFVASIFVLAWPARRTHEDRPSIAAPQRISAPAEEKLNHV